MLSQIRLLLGVKSSTLKGAAASEWESNKLKLIAGGITLLVLVPGIYILFRFLFGYIYSLEETFMGFGLALARRLLGMTFMSFGVFIAISAFISVVSVMFRSRETSFLLTLPVDDRIVATYRMFESWFNAGWATVLLGIPVIVAFCISLGLHLHTTVFAVMLLPLLIIIWVSSGTILLGAAVRISRRRGRLWRTAGLLGLAVVLGIYLVLKSSGPESILAADDLGLDAVSKFVADLPVAGGRLWPHVLFGEAVSSMSSGMWVEALKSTGLLLAQACIGVLISYWIICTGFRRRYSSITAISTRRRSSSLLLNSGGRFRTMFSKDVLVFLRDPVQWSQLLLLVGLFLIYVLNISRFPLDISQPLWRSVLVYLNFSFSCFVTATLLVRFTFPTVSLEGQGISYILQLPAGRKLLLGTKWMESSMLVLPLVIGLGIWSTMKIGAGWVLIVSSTLALGLMCFALVSINIGLGAVFPRFDRASAASIASGQGGIIAAFASMSYVLTAVMVLGFTFRQSFPVGVSESVLIGPMATALLFLFIVTVAVTFISMRTGYRSLVRRDF